MESILFGTNMTKLLITAFSIIQKILKLKWSKAFRIIVFLICLMGFSIHNYFVVKEIINQELIENGYFEKIEDIKLPNLVFCFEFDETKIDSNFQLTGEFLNEITGDLKIDDVFKKIAFFNRTGFEDLRITTGDNEILNPNISVTSFYFFDLKCFEIELKITYKVEYFYFYRFKTVLGVTFDKTLFYRHNYTYFTYKKPETKFFNSFFYYKI